MTTKTNDDQYRAGFEAWADSEEGGLMIDRDPERDGDGYWIHETDHAWRGYLAAMQQREASTEPSADLVEALRAALRSVNAVAIERGDKFGACDQIDNSGTPYQSQWFADLVAGQPKQGTATATEPSTSGFCLTDRGLSFPDGSHITPEGEVTGPLAHAMAGQIGQVVARLKAGAGALPDEAADWRERAAQACYTERVDADETKAPEDIAYNQAIENCMDAIRNLDGVPDEAKDAARLEVFIDWFIQGRARHQIHEHAHMVPTTREIVLEWLDAAIEVQAKAGKAS